MELFGNEPEIETLLVWVPLHSTESFRECLRIAMLAAGTDLRAPAHWIPCRISPLDCGSLSQSECPFSPVPIEDVNDDVLCGLLLSCKEQVVEYRVC